MMWIWKRAPPSDAKMKDIHEFQTPSAKTQVRSFLRMTSYYSCYKNNYSVTAVEITMRQELTGPFVYPQFTAQLVCILAIHGPTRVKFSKTRSGPYKN